MIKTELSQTHFIFPEIKRKKSSLEEELPIYKTKCPKCSSAGSIQFTLYGLLKKLEDKNLVVIDSEVIRVEPDGRKLLIDDFYPDKEICFKGKGIRIISKNELAGSGNKKNISEATDSPFYKRYIPLVIQSTCSEHSTYFKSVDSFDLDRIKESEESSSCNLPKRNFAINEGPKSKDLIRRNIKYYSELFYPRQAIYLNESKKLIQKVPEEHRLWLSLLISTSLEFNSALCGYKGAEARRSGAIRHVFSHHAYSFPHTSLENNPIFQQPTSGTLLRLFRTKIQGASKWANNPIERKKTNGNTIFRDIAINEFGSYDNTLVFSEVGLKGIGNFDFVMIKHKPLSATVEDFVIIEFQTGQTTGTGKLVNGFNDYFTNKDFSEKSSYGFGINSYDIWKRTFTQILNKGIILEKWKKKIYWVVQQPIFDYFHKKYRLKNLSYNKSQSTVFALYDLTKKRSKLSLVQTNMYSSTVDDLFNAFRKNDEIPPVHTFIEGLEKKLKTDFRLGLSLKISSKPSVSGIVKEQPKMYGE